MAKIEWRSNMEIEPDTGSITEFCEENSIPPIKIDEGHRLLVFIDRPSLEALHQHLSNDLSREHGGVLVGKAFYDGELGIHYALIRRTIPALESEGSAVHLQFTPETWAFISGIIEENFPDQMVVGWYHSHPGLGVFMSGTDRSTQREFYSHPWNVAVVADPIAGRTGWFFGPDCDQLGNDQVILYDAVQPEILREDEDGVPALSSFQNQGSKWKAPDLRWLLPFGMTVLGIFILARWLEHQQYDGNKGDRR